MRLLHYLLLCLLLHLILDHLEPLRLLPLLKELLHLMPFLLNEAYLVLHVFQLGLVLKGLQHHVLLRQLDADPARFVIQRTFKISENLFFADLAVVLIVVVSDLWQRVLEGHAALQAVACALVASMAD